MILMFMERLIILLAAVDSLSDSMLTVAALTDEQ